MDEKRLPETKVQAVPFRHLPLLPLSSRPYVLNLARGCPETPC
jgi:hypothetical protein